MIDTHCHLDFPEFENTLDEVLSQAKKMGVTRYIVPAVGRGNWQKLEVLQSNYPEIEVAYGIHPWFLENFHVNDLQILSDWIGNHSCVAIGECGLDFYHSRDNEVQQKTIFEFQLNLAKKHDLPVITHSRKAVEEVLQLCKQHKIKKGVLHGFAGSTEQAKQAIKMGFYIGVGGVICNLKATKIRTMVAQVPLQNILLETDSPDQGIQKGVAGTPADIIPIAQALAALHCVSFEEVKAQCAANAKACFTM